MKIKVKYVPSEYQLGTTDGYSWHIYPDGVDYTIVPRH